jgi:hypothetical protein
MPRFQGLHVVPNNQTPERPSRGLEPYLALEPRRKSKSRAELPLGELTNEDLGIEPFGGWRLGAIWLALMLVSIAILIVLGYGLLAVLP